jgi:glycosyltransferase involved in cell wall biosynthesis
MARKPTIAFIHPSGPTAPASYVVGGRTFPGIGGTDTVLRHLFGHYVRQGFRVVAYHQLDADDLGARQQDRWNGVDVVTTPAASVAWSVASARARGEAATTNLITQAFTSELARVRPDIVHVHNLHDRSVAPIAAGARAAAQAVGAATVHTAHNIWAQASDDPTYFPQGYDANLFACPATYWAYARRGADLSNAAVVAVGVDMDVFTPDGSRRKEIDDQPPGLRLALPGRPDLAKGAEDVIRALGILHRSDPALRIQLTLCDGFEAPGQDASLDAFRRAISGTSRAEGIADRVHLLPTPYEMMPAMMRSADVVVVPSRVQEGGYPQTLTEALATARPVISTLDGGQEQAIRLAYGPSADQVLVPAADPRKLATALRRLALDPSLRTSLGMLGRRSASKHFNIADTLRQHDQCYQHLAPDLVIPALRSPTTNEGTRGISL